MLKIGITGGIGTGKSMIAKIFSTLGVPIYDADSRAKWLINNNLQLRKEIKEFFGKDAYDAFGNYNTAFIAKQVFDKPEALKMLNQLVHPVVGEDTQKWIEKQKSAYILKEAALLNQANGVDLDKIILVTAPMALRLERIKNRDSQRTDAEIQAIMNRQRTETEFKKIADFIMVNDEITPLLPQILALDKNFRSGK
jgi:dephospho-CoA kinase